MKTSHALLSILVLLAAGSTSTQGQVRGSEHSTLSQTIDGTELRIDYYRPRMRGRERVFGDGGIVWEHVWTPGANWATKFSFQKPIEFSGTPIPAGTYSVWFQTDEHFVPTEFFFEPDTLIFHLAGPPRAADQIRIPVTVGEAPFREVLTWDFEDIRSDGGTLAMRWGTSRITFDVKVEPSMRLATTPDEAAPVLGIYQATITGPDGEAGAPFTVTFRRTEDGILHGDWEGVPEGPDGMGAFLNALDMWVLPGGADGWFVPAEAYDGELWETWAGSFFEFEVADGKSPSFLLRDEMDNVMVRGVRRD
jgi:hypothetical protein